MCFDLKKIKEFILLRFKEEIGGFGATPLLPPTIEDTYFGVKSLYFLNRNDLSRFSSEIHQFLSNHLEKTHLDLVSLYRLLTTWHLIGNNDISEIPSLRGLNLENFTFFGKSSLRLYALWSIARERGDKKIQQKIKKYIKFFPIRTLEDLYYIGKIDNNLWIKNKDMVIKSQNGDGGFGFYPKTTSFLENTYFALKILYSLGISEENVFQRGVEFIKACNNSDGGFGRKPGGISYLETTSLSIEILYILKKISG